MTAPSRFLPDAALLVLTALRANAVDAVDEMPMAGAMRYPLVYVQRLPGSGAVHPRFYDMATIETLAFAKTRTAALDLAETARATLYLAWERQTCFPTGSISHYEETSGPWPLPHPVTAPVNEVVIQSTYRLGISPA